MAGSIFGAFDDDHPPSKDLIDDCVHCGFCLTTCPTYVLWGQEMDTPRGRIQLMKQGLEGAPLSDSMVQHFDACLGCMACVTACPSGVQYDRLIEQTRAQVERHHTRAPAQRALRWMIFMLFPRPNRLRWLRFPLWLGQRSGLDRLVSSSRLVRHLFPSLAAMQSLAPRLDKRGDVPEFSPAQGKRRARVGMLTGCVQREFFSGVNAATARVLTAEGCDVIAPKGQGCCGALSAHAGRKPEAQRYARALINTFEAADISHIVVNSAGCGSSMKEYTDLLADDPAYADRAARFTAMVRDLSEILVELGPVAERTPLSLAVAYHDACHLGHAQRVRSQPRELLRQIPGLELREIPESDVCCGSAGIYNILHPEAGQELGDRKMRSVLQTGADVVITANPGCLMQLMTAARRAGRDVRMMHTAQVLDASIRGVRLP